jgi:hypothetical protein
VTDVSFYMLLAWGGHYSKKVKYTWVII